MAERVPAERRHRGDGLKRQLRVCFQPRLMPGIIRKGTNMLWKVILLIIPGLTVVIAVAILYSRSMTGDDLLTSACLTYQPLNSIGREIGR